MPTQKPIIPVTMDPELVRRIDDYRRTVQSAIPSRSEAIRCLIEEGLSKHEKKGKK
jgi:metal-responsive CopG/Arc/MetJ family transcriptional regulator